MVLGRSLAASSNAASVATGTVNVNGGTLRADTIYMADVLGNAQARGFLNISGGTVEATTIAAGPGAGAGTPVRQLKFNSGVLTHKAGSDLTVSSAISFRLEGNSGKEIFADAGRSVTINSNISDFGSAPFAGLTKTGDGTLYLNGTSTYTGPTLVSEGVLGGTGSVVSTVTVGSGAMLAPGASAGIMTVGATDLQPGSTLQIEIGGTTPGPGGYDQLIVTGNASLAGELEIVILPGFTLDSSDVFTILTAGNIDGTFSNALTAVGISNGIGFFEVSYSGGVVTLSNFQVPEPGSLSLLAMGALVLVQRRRRNQKS